MSTCGNRAKARRYYERHRREHMRLCARIIEEKAECFEERRSMPEFTRARYRVLRIAAATTVADARRRRHLLAQLRAEDRRATSTLSVAEALESLGPGPLPPRPAASTRVDRPKAATLEDAIDQCVEFNMAAVERAGCGGRRRPRWRAHLRERLWGQESETVTGPVDPETIFRIGSVTKQMTAAAVMQQVELGRVDLDAPVTDYIPEFEVGGRWPADRIKVWHTLTHTTGFPDRVNDMGRGRRRRGAFDLGAGPG